MSGGVAVVTEKPAFIEDQITKSTDAAKKFGEIRQKAKIMPQIILNNGEFDLVILDYKEYERLYMRVQDLEEQIVVERLEQLDGNPSLGISLTEVGHSLGLEE